MSAPANRILDLVIAELMHDERFPKMSATAWSVKLQTLRCRIDDIIAEVEHEARVGAIREYVDY